MRLLIVEDEPRLAELIQGALRRDGIESDLAPDMEQAGLALETVHYEAVILDLSLPDGRGEDLLVRYRLRKGNSPILILTAEDAVQSRIDCLNAGADDYLIKPFDMGELVARVRALLRRPEGALGVVLRVGNIDFDVVGRHVVVGGTGLELSRRELSVLEYLMRREGRVVPKEILEAKLYDHDRIPDSNPIPVHIHNLRKKLQNLDATADIATIRGVGYMLHHGV